MFDEFLAYVPVKLYNCVKILYNITSGALLKLKSYSSSFPAYSEAEAFE